MAFINDKPFDHTTRRGVTFTCDRSDLSTPIYITGLHRSPLVMEVAQATAEFAAWHALHIHPHLNGFRGYDSLEFEVPEKG